MADKLTLPIPSPAPVATAPAPVPLVQSAGNLLPIPGEVSQTSYAGRVSTPGLMGAAKQRRNADAGMDAAQTQAVAAADTGAEAIRLKQEADNVTARKNLALENIAAKEAEDTFIRAKQAESAAANRIAQQEEQYRQMDNQTFFGESKTWQKLLWGVSLALGGYGSALSRGQNTPLLLLTKTIDDWSDRQARRMEALSKDISAGKTALGSVAQEYALKEQQLLPLRKAAAYGKVGDLTDKEVEAQAAAGNKDAAARGMKLSAEARAKQAEERQKAAKAEEQAQQFLAPTSGSIRQGPGQKITEGQAEAAARLGEMGESIGRFNKNYPKTDQEREAFRRSLEIYQDNTTKLDRVGKTGGATGAILELGGRATGYVPRGAFEGIKNEAHKEAIRGAEDLRKKQQQILTGAGFSNAEVQENMNIYGISPTMTPQEMSNAIGSMAKTMRTRAVQAGPVLGPAIEAKAAQLEEEARGLVSGGGGSAPKYIPGQVIERGGAKWRINPDGKTATEIE